MTPREPSVFEEWINNTIAMLENTKTTNEEDVSFNEDGLGFELYNDPDWTFVGGGIECTYVIDLDNFVFTVNATTHLKLGNMPPSDPGLEAYFEAENKIKITPQHLSTTVNLWPPPLFDTTERQQEYEALHPLVTSAEEWGLLTWNKLSAPQRFSTDLTHYLLKQTPSKMVYPYARSAWEKPGYFCWNMLCAATSSVPLCCDDIGAHPGHRAQILSTASPGGYRRLTRYETLDRVGRKVFKSFKSRGFSVDYCWAGVVSSLFAFIPAIPSAMAGSSTPPNLPRPAPAKVPAGNISAHHILAHRTTLPSVVCLERFDRYAFHIPDTRKVSWEGFQGSEDARQHKGGSKNEECGGEEAE
ncbi:hypothetical protein B0J17DRAFT_629355 [Rhizoctonia solani]|nr:hypothetical protein B0J17DRAFT_629355 [Rhizoctonia solani]